MKTWRRRGHGRIVACLGAALVLSLSACATVRGLGEDLSAASDGARMAVFGGDPDRAPVD